jgi:class 3 adenylate cyclase/tetratricopeptide (TPR) repeat protein
VKRTSFKPSVIDTSGTALPGELQELVETLAKNTHNVWAQQRLLDGWSYGRHRDDKSKRHPGLIAYEQLTESEKDYDRNTAVETLKAIQKVGYQLVRSGDATRATAIDASSNSLQFLDQIGSLNLSSLLALWHARTPGEWDDAPEIYRYLGQRVLKLGEPLLAYDVLSEGLRSSPADVRLQQLLALALARSGATLRANALLLRLVEQGRLDEETLGILARTHKDLWARALAPAERTRQLRLAHKFYAEAYKLSRGYYAGINAATLSLQLGKNDQAIALAREVRNRCLKEMDRLAENDPNRYWTLATLGEAALILRRWSEAEDCYSQAADIGRGQFVELSSTRRNARIILDHFGRDRKQFERCFRIPRVVAFSGLMIDRRGRANARFPPQLESAVRDAISSRLKQLDVGAGFASAAPGSDILFLETLLELGGDAHIVLPYGQDQFIKDSVETVPGANWRERFERVLVRAAEVITASDQKLEEGGTSYEYANLLVHGLASIKARQLETEFVPLAVWDRLEGDGPGGTSSAIEQWRNVGLEVDLIDLTRIVERHCPDLTATPVSPTSGTRGRRALPGKLTTDIMAMLFADAVNFSKLSERQIPGFLKYFLGAIGDLIASSNYSPVAKNTWGDGLYFVFPNVRDAGQFSLELCELIVTTNWSKMGLPKELNLRIALHAGPVYSGIDPVTGQPTFTGTHVNRAARIEPITPPGQVYASQAFAALAAAQRVEEFTCDYVGQTPLAKGYGTFPTYHVRRANQSELTRGRSVKTRKPRQRTKSRRSR